MLEINIPGFGAIGVAHLVCDFTGTLSVDGRLISGVAKRLDELAATLTIHVVTADTFGRVHEELAGHSCNVSLVRGTDLDVQKQRYVLALGAGSVVAIGNGANDRLMLRTARLGIAIIEGEGCAKDAMLNADILVRSILDGLSLLLNPQRIAATLRV